VPKEITFTPATKEQARARALIFGPSGSGKTFTGLLATFGMAGATSIEDCADERFRSIVGVIDSQHGQASKYSHRFAFSHYILDPPYHPQHYINAIKKAEQSGFTHLLIDGITHEWDGEGGVKEIVDKAKGQFGGNSQAAWSIGTPLHNKFFEAIIASDCHIVCTARAKTQWVPGEDSKGRSIFVKVGEAPMQRETAEYEFDVSVLMDMENTGTISKTHVDPQFPPGLAIEKPGIDNFAVPYLAWLNDGVKPKPKEAEPEPEADAPAERVTDEQAEAIVQTIDALQLDFGDYAEGVTWAQQLDERMVEWYGTAEVEALSVAQGADLAKKLVDTRKKKQREAAAAA
jgi:hypothetical protein